MEKGRLLIYLALVLAMTFATYAVCLKHFFFLDDFWHLDYARRTSLSDVWRPWVYSWEDDKAYWFAASRVHRSSEQAFFRPLVSLVYIVGLRTWGASPAAFHAVSLGAHLAATAALFWLAWRLFRTAWIAAFCGAVFGLHPGQFEAVEWIAANADALLALFGILCVAAFAESELRRPEGRGFYALSLGFFALALGSKEMAVTIPLVLLGTQVLLSPRGSGWRKVLHSRWKRHAPFWLLAFAYALWRLPSLVGIYKLHPGGNYISDIHTSLFVPQVVLNFSYYLFHFLVPYPIFPVNFREILGFHCWWLAAACTVAIVVTIRLLARGADENHRILRLGGFWVAATILPFSFVDPAQRLVHFPAAGFALAAGGIAAILERELFLHHRRFLPWITSVLLGAYVAGSFSYASGLGFVAKRVEKVTRGLEREISVLPPKSEIYLIDLWQPAWMFEHFFALTRPSLADQIHVLTLDPEIIPPDLQGSAGLLGRWFRAQFGDTGNLSPPSVDWELPTSLTLRRERGGYLSGIVDKILDVSPQASDPRRETDAGPFIARAVGTDPEGVKGFSFRWKERPESPPRFFFLWSGNRWERLLPPQGWGRSSEPDSTDAKHRGGGAVAQRNLLRQSARYPSRSSSGSRSVTVAGVS